MAMTIRRQPWPRWRLAARPPLNHLAALPRHHLPRFVQESPVACHYLDWVGALDWEHFPESRRCPAENDQRRGPVPQPTAPYVAAFLVKVDRQLPHMAQLRQYLIEQPALPWLFGFPLVASTAFPWGFDVAASLPAHRHFNRVLQHLPNRDLQFLLSSSIDLLRSLLPPDTRLGDEISLDTKHIIAWVKENNPKEFIKGGRFHKERQPKGDPDCKVGFKANANQAPAAPKTDGTPGSKARVGDYYWGYASGLVATKVPHWGEVVLAEQTLPFDHGELSYFLPLMRQVEQRLGRRPRFAALDAAFDAFYVYAYFHHAGGFAAVPLRNSNEALRQFAVNGLPLCDAGLPMPRKGTFLDHTHLLHHRRGRYACPLCFPKESETPCPIGHKNRNNGGCVTTMPTSIGTRVRSQLERKGERFQQIYRQRTATERIFSQAFELGIERPKLRNGRSIANLNTLIYLTINLRTRQRIRQPSA
jgi:hypothetical protein